VLKPEYDPYRFDTENGHINAAWFAGQAARFWPDATIHLRGMHYRLVVANTVRKPNGDIYVNTDADWKWLQAEASAAARWLAYVPFSSIIDERNSPPLLFVPDDEIPSAALYGGVRVDVPSLDDAMPSLEASGFVARQPNRVVLIGEKSSLADVLRPIAERIEGELILPTGEATITQIAELAARADADGRRLVVIYFSDFDPAGHQMPVSVSRKLQALRDLEFPNLEIEVHVAALTRSQCEEYDLPSTPLKDTEKRGDNWRAVMGREQTEIDALAAVRPDVLRQIAEDAVAPFCDDSLDERTEIARDAWTEAAALLLAAHPDYDRARQSVADARDAVLEVWSSDSTRHRTKPSRCSPKSSRRKSNCPRRGSTSRRRYHCSTATTTSPPPRFG
jgi:hypothetical protein